MKAVSSIEIKKLFGCFDYNIKSINKNKITILIGMNGSGKTTVLKMISCILKNDLSIFCNTEFESFKICFTNKDYILITKNDSNIISAETYKCGIKNETDILDYSQKYTKIYNAIDNFIEEFPYVRDTELINFIRNRETQKLLNYVLEEDHYSLGKQEMYPLVSLVKELKEITQNTQIFLNKDEVSESKEIFVDRLESNPLSRDNENTRRFIGRRITIESQGLRSIIAKINIEIRETNGKYSKESIEQDKSFVSKIIKNYQSNVTSDSLEKNIKALTNKLLNLSDIGLSKELNTFSKIPDNLKYVVNLYCTEAIKRLSVFDDLQKKLSSLFSIINSKFGYSNKNITIVNDEICVVDKKSNIINWNKLSSGEKHLIVIFGDLIFNSNESQLLLIDEPEISMHVDWQEKFLDNLSNILEINDSTAIVATHSPFIVNKWESNLIQATC